MRLEDEFVARERQQVGDAVRARPAVPRISCEPERERRAIELVAEERRRVVPAAERQATPVLGVESAIGPPSDGVADVPAALVVARQHETCRPSIRTATGTPTGCSRLRNAAAVRRAEGRTLIRPTSRSSERYETSAAEPSRWRPLSTMLQPSPSRNTHGSRKMRHVVGGVDHERALGPRHPVGAVGGRDPDAAPVVVRLARRGVEDPGAPPSSRATSEPVQMPPSPSPGAIGDRQLPERQHVGALRVAPVDVRGPLGALRQVLEERVVLAVVVAEPVRVVDPAGRPVKWNAGAWRSVSSTIARMVATGSLGTRFSSVEAVGLLDRVGELGVAPAGEACGSRAGRAKTPPGAGRGTRRRVRRAR